MAPVSSVPEVGRKTEKDTGQCHVLVNGSRSTR